MRFSERTGIRPLKSLLQIDNVDAGLRNRLWNLLIKYYWPPVKPYTTMSDLPNMQSFLKILWDDYFKEPTDAIGRYWENNYNRLRKYFFECPWYEVYDFLEFVATRYPEQYRGASSRFINACNTVLEEELSAYRYVGGKITQITSEEEIGEIEQALAAPASLKAVTHHLRRALELLADKKSPDYRNSIKESISAVEAICNLITGNAKSTLGQALKEIESKVPLHPALKSAFSNLYGYTSDAEGIRHALLEEPNLNFEDAKFMLVSCSAFINYLIAKASKAGIKL